MRKPPQALVDFLEAYPSGVSRLFLAARRVVLRAAPEANELIYDAYNAVTVAYSFSGRLKEAFCHVAAYSSHVNLGFNRGADLPDPEGVLRGTGVRVRHVRISTAANLNSPALDALVRGAVLQGRGLATTTRSEAAAEIRPTTGGKRRPMVRPRSAG
jgi:hypothetical protein